VAAAVVAVGVDERHCFGVGDLVPVDTQRSVRPVDTDHALGAEEARPAVVVVAATRGKGRCEEQQKCSTQVLLDRHRPPPSG
jgi:hypothetical protein